MAISGCGFGEGGGESSGVAVGCRKHIELIECCSDDLLPKELNTRYTVKHVGAICRGGFHICSGYLHTAVGIHHKLNLDWLQAAVGALSMLKGPWVLAAGFNCTPQQLEETGWLKMVNGRIVAPHHPACKNRVIDFFLVSNSMAGMVVGAVTVVSDALCKPHKPARLYLKADARTMTVRMLKKVGNFGAVLPHGSAWPHDDLGDIEDMINDQKYGLFISRMEREVVNLLALDDKTAKQFIGRADGPKFVQQKCSWK